ncbi:MAG: twin-arginine translocation signal domain-containing protein [bacterium]|nr:twin-arginine translocation signal domain-containing protein [bacterium]
MSNSDSRRGFLKKTGVAATAGLLIKTSAWAAANDTFRVAVTGLHGRGQDHVSGYAHLKDKNVKIVAVCDVDENVLNERIGEFVKENKIDANIKKYTDFRKLLEDKEIDAVSCATPNHWHSLMGIWACEAGKDAYIEKPISHNIREGRELVEAARKYKRIVQHGTQIRSSKAIQEAMQLLKDGEIGEVYYAKGTCYKWRNTIGHKEPSPVPPGVHYDEWLGPAPERPFTENRFHYNWHWHWDYGNGDIGNQGVHQIDVCRWGLGQTWPDLTTTLGGHFMFEDDQETPNTMVTTYKWNDVNKMMVFEVRHWITNDELVEGDKGNVVGCLFLGSEGYMVIPSYSRYKCYMGREREPGKEGNEGGDHFLNFVEACRSRNHEDLNADVLEGHISAGMAHLANASYKIERTIRFDPKKEVAIDDKEADDLLHERDRGYRAPYSLPAKV